MNVVATSKYVRLSPSKARDLARAIRGVAVSDALQLVQFSSRKAAAQIGKTLKSAISNAENNADLAADTLTVKEVTVDDGPRLRRYWPRARGSASPIKKRTCHIRVVLTDGIDGEEA